MFSLDFQFSSGYVTWEQQWSIGEPLSSNSVPAIVVNSLAVPAGQRYLIILCVPRHQRTTIDHVERHDWQPSGR